MSDTPQNSAETEKGFGTGPPGDIAVEQADDGAGCEVDVVAALDTAGVLRIDVSAEERPRPLTMFPMDVLGPRRARLVRQHRHSRLQRVPRE